MKSKQEILDSKRVVIVEEDPEGFIGTYTTYKFQASVVCSWGAGWEHVSISPFKHSYMPSWEDMCNLKDVFFRDDEAVIEMHPPKNEYVNNMGNCLHLWRCSYKDMVLPPSCLVGLRKGQTWSEVKKEIKKAYELAGEEYGK